MLYSTKLHVLKPGQRSPARKLVGQAKKTADKMARKVHNLDQKDGVDLALGVGQVQLKNHSSFLNRVCQAAFNEPERGLSGTARFNDGELESLDIQKPTDAVFPDQYLYKKIEDGSEVYAAPKGDLQSTVVRKNADGTLFIVDGTLTPRMDFEDLCQGEIRSLSETSARRRPRPEAVKESSLVADEPKPPEAVKQESKPVADVTPPEASQTSPRPVMLQVARSFAHRLADEGAVFAQESYVGLSLGVSDHGLHLEGQIVGGTSLRALGRALQRDGEGGFQYGGIPVEMSESMQAVVHHSKGFGLVGWGNG